MVHIVSALWCNNLSISRYSVFSGATFDPSSGGSLPFEAFFSISLNVSPKEFPYLEAFKQQVIGDSIIFTVLVNLLTLKFLGTDFCLTSFSAFAQYILGLRYVLPS